MMITQQGPGEGTTFLPPAGQHFGVKNIGVLSENAWGVEEPDFNIAVNAFKLSGKYIRAADLLQHKLMCFQEAGKWVVGVLQPHRSVSWAEHYDVQFARAQIDGFMDRHEIAKTAVGVLVAIFF